GNAQAPLEVETAVEFLLARNDDMLFMATDRGAVAALDAASGELVWLSEYPRQLQRGVQLLDRAWHRQRNPAPCLVAGGRLLVAPADYPGVLALDVATGRCLWQAQVPAGTFDAVHLLGVHDNRVIASGRRLWWIDLDDGRLSRDVV